MITDWSKHKCTSHIKLQIGLEIALLSKLEYFNTIG